jgi:hypothetical protein
MARRPVLKLLCAILLGLALLIGAFFAWIHTLAERRWADLKARLPELRAEAKGRDPRRPTLGEPLPGNAWDDYQKATRELGGFDLKDVIAFLKGGDAERARVALALSGGVLEPLERGTQRSEGAHPGEGILDVHSARCVALLAAVQGRLASGGQNAAFAATRLWQAAQMCADLGRNARAMTYWVALSDLGLVFKQMEALPPDPELAKGLALLDASWPDVGDALRNEALAIFERLASAAPLSVEHRDLKFWNAWRYGFSKRLMEAVAAETALEVLRGAAEASAKPWRESRRAIREERELMESRNPVLREILEGFPPVFRLSFERRAQLRLLRRYHGETAEMDDPFGGSLKAWSVGPNGIDDGGKKDDIVLELPR